MILLVLSPKELVLLSLLVILSLLLKLPLDFSLVSLFNCNILLIFHVLLIQLSLLLPCRQLHFLSLYHLIFFGLHPASRSLTPDPVSILPVTFQLLLLSLGVSDFLFLFFVFVLGVSDGLLLHDLHVVDALLTLLSSPFESVDPVFKHKHL